jgi:hypothetical protein
MSFKNCKEWSTEKAYTWIIFSSAAVLVKSSFSDLFILAINRDHSRKCIGEEQKGEWFILVQKPDARVGMLSPFF